MVREIFEHRERLIRQGRPLPEYQPAIWSVQYHHTEVSLGSITVEDPDPRLVEEARRMGFKVEGAAA